MNTEKSIVNFETDVIEKGPNAGKVYIAFKRDDGEWETFVMSPKDMKFLSEDITDTLNLIQP